MWPVIIRELRAESRRPFTYWLRVIGAIAILGAVVFTLQQPDRWANNAPFPATGIQSQQLLGRLLFGNVNAALFALIWLIVPLLTADCINREKREGTLGLLFLTPLTARGIVVGKSFAHALRALTFVLTMLPVLAVPLLMGGVDPKDFLMALLLDFSALLLALAAGLLASSWTKQWMWAVLLAESLSFLFAILMMTLHRESFETALNAAARMPGSGLGFFSGGAAAGWTSYSPFERRGEGFTEWILNLFYFNTASDVDIQPMWMARGFRARFTSGGVWNTVWTSGSATFVHTWFRVAGLVFAGACMFFIAAILLAARCIQRSWRVQTSSVRAVRLERKFCEPRYLPGAFRKKMRRSLERNPIGWLQQYSVAARMTKWGWCLFVALVECVLTLNLHDVRVGQMFVFQVLLMALAFSAAGSFRRERETGALELLLVTPLRVRQIVAGRLCGIWMQFLPAGVLALLATFYVATFNGRLQSSDYADLALGLLLILSSFFTVPVVGLYWSMRRANFLVAWIGVIVTALVLPWCAAAFWLLIQERREPASAMLVLIAVQLSIALLCNARLMANLSARRFVITS